MSRDKTETDYGAKLTEPVPLDEMREELQVTDYGAELTELVPLNEMREELPVFALVFVAGVMVGALILSAALLWMAL